MKKLLVLLASLSLFLLAACGESTTEEVSSELKKEAETEKAEAEKKKEEVTEEVEEEESEEATTDVEEVNQNIADDDIVKIDLINVERITDEFMGDSIKVNFEIENRSDVKIVVQSRDLSIDGYMADDFSSMSAEVMPGKKAKDSLTIDEMFLDEGEELPKLEDTLEMSLLVADYETFEDINSYDVHIDFK